MGSVMGNEQFRFSEINDFGDFEFSSNPSENSQNPEISLNQEGAPPAIIWQSLAPRLRSVLGALDFKAWIEPLHLIGSENGLVFLHAANAFARSRIRTEYLHRLQAIWNDFDPQKRRLVIDCAKNEPIVSSAVSEPEKAIPQTVSNPQIFEPIELNHNPKTFENFECGLSNRVAVALAKRLAIEPPNGELCYIHGFNGVGKTHLLSAIAVQAHISQPNVRVVSLSAQRFLHLFQTALRDKDTVNFKEGLRAADIFLIDDIQLICGKLATQEELFQTIIDLLSAGKNVVATGDVPIMALHGLTPRMQGILQGGFATVIDEPDFELRRKIAIMKAKEFALKRKDFAPPQEAFDILAARIIGTGRAIEGAVKQIFAASALVGQEATMETVLEAIGERFPTPAKTVPVDTIKKRVAAHFDISIEDLIGTRRHISVARPRQIAMYFCKKFTKRSFPDIASRMGGRDHTTVMHAVKRIEELANSDPKFASLLQTIANKILV